MLALLCLAVVLASLLGGMLPLATVLTHTRLQLYLSLSAGAMLGAAFFHMLPEAVHLGSPGTLRWAAVGLLALFFVERFFAYHHHEAPEVPGDPCPEHAHEEHSHGPGRHSAGLVAAEAPGGGTTGVKGVALHWGAAACGLALHSFIGGIALAGAASADRATNGGVGVASWGVFIATLIHKPADALTITSLMMRAGVPRLLAHLVNLGFALMIPLGATAFWITSNLVGGGFSAGLTAATLAFSAGTFLCIALSDLLPELQFHAHDRVKLSAALLLGLGIMALAGAFESDHSHEPVVPKAAQPTAPALMK